MSEIKVNSIVDASGGSAVQVNGFTPTVSNMAGRNRIINGDMRIDQRNAGAAVTGISSGSNYITDRFSLVEATDAVFTAQQDTSAPSGFVNSLKITTTTADASIGATQYVFVVQRIEGTNTSDFGWGASGASTVTLSFWVRSSLTGTFSGALSNGAFNYSYAFEYSISAADTWEKKTITISGPTAGTWLTTNGIGVQVIWSLGHGLNFDGTANTWESAGDIGTSGSVAVAGTLNATFYITGVQLEEGSVATPFEHRQYGQELALCQRYYQKSYDYETVPGTNTTVGSVTSRGDASSTMTQHALTTRFVVTMRAVPTMVLYSRSGTSGSVSDCGISATTENGTVSVSSLTGLGTNGLSCLSLSTAAGPSISMQYTAEAEL